MKELYYSSLTDKEKNRLILKQEEELKVEADDDAADLSRASTPKQESPSAEQVEQLLEAQDDTNLVSEEDEKPDTDWCTFDDFCKICTLDISESDKMTRWSNLLY